MILGQELNIELDNGSTQTLVITDIQGTSFDNNLILFKMNSGDTISLNLSTITNILLDDPTVGLDEIEQDSKAPFSIFPNPSSGKVSIVMDQALSPKEGILILDLFGRSVREISLDRGASAYEEFIWDGKDENGISVQNGVYFVIIQIEGKSYSKRMVIER